MIVIPYDRRTNSNVTSIFLIQQHVTIMYTTHVSK